MTGRKRLRELGIGIGARPTGPYNAITDVAGVLVGHGTVMAGDSVRTGVTAIKPNEGNIFTDRVVGGAFVLNGAGEMSGLIQVMEWGLIETPILLTNTLSVGSVSEATVRYMIDRYPGIGRHHDVVIPVVGECDDSFLNDIAGGHVDADHVIEALDGAATGPVTEGCVGGGTGMVSFGFKAGIGTSSRMLAAEEGGYTVGVLVMSNFGRAVDLCIDGVPMGRVLASHAVDVRKRYGSIIAVVATDAPLTSNQLNRVCKRVALGIGRVGSYAAHGSGEIIIGFSTANTVPREARHRTYSALLLADAYMDPVYQASIEATEEAIVNAMCAAVSTTGFEGHYSPALPLEEVARLHARFHPLGLDA
ncbi:MAG: P1 family peptidase [Myxococcales bacterium]|nr:P1 family peptidase [Myxococcales bacterium]